MNALIALRTAASSVAERHIVRSAAQHRPSPFVAFGGLRHQQQQQQQRCKHSQRIKKRMARHPARVRVQGRIQEGARTAEPTLEGAQPVSPPPPPPPATTPTYPKVFEPELLMNGWSAPPADQSALIQKYPFQVSRTKNKPSSAVGFLPVYTFFRKDGTKVTTRIKKVTGNVDAFLSELHANLPTIPPSDVQHRVGGTIELKGNHVRPVKLWLASLGF